MSLPATVYGRLALHRDVHRTDHKRWTITHLPTGMRIIDDIDSLKKARAFVSHLTRLNWNFTDPRKIPPETKRGVEETYDVRFNALSQIKKWNQVWRPN